MILSGESPTMIGRTGRGSENQIFQHPASNAVSFGKATKKAPTTFLSFALDVKIHIILCVDFNLSNDGKGTFAKNVIKNISLTRRLIHLNLESLKEFEREVLIQTLLLNHHLGLVKSNPSGAIQTHHLFLVQIMTQHKTHGSKVTSVL